ncbi:hypothetical protein [Gelidibacter sp.]|uniref:hypothetical protein n=1 Tax=Gelidibacter sp. TaxID=2018083 RepID=UPI002C2995E8|nr:hypothetical protein [Gelidibacter sp.]HUH28432.1 hypothetical protein [Gelidibacter sp.]
MKNNRRISGGIGLLVGYIFLILLIDILSKPDNVAVSIKPIDSMATYFFGFGFTLGILGWVLGALLLIGWLALFYSIGTWIHKLMFTSKS